MGGIGNKFALSVQRRFQAVEQGVHRTRQRTDFDGNEGFVDRFQRRVGLPVEGIGEICQRVELLVHHAPYDHPTGQEQEQQRHHDRDHELNRYPIPRAYALRHLHNDRIAVQLVDAHLGRTHAHALVVRLEDVGVVNPAHVRAGQRQIRFAGDLAFAVADPVDELFYGIGKHRAGERRHRHRRVDARQLDLLGDGRGEIGQRAVDHVLRVLPRKPIRHQAAHQREERQRRGKAAQQRAPQAGRHARRRGCRARQMQPVGAVETFVGRAPGSESQGAGLPLVRLVVPSTNRLRRGLPDFLQQVAETSHRHDFHAAVFQFLANPVHVDFNGGVTEIAAEVRQVILQLRLADHTAVAQQQHFEHGEFTRRHFERLFVVENATIDARQAQAAQRYFRTRYIAMRAAAAHHSADPRFEFSRFKGFEHVVVGAAVQALDAVMQFVARGQDNHWRMTIALAETRQQRHAVNTWQTEIENHEFVAILRERLLRENAVVNHIYGKAGLFKATLNAARDGAVVFDQKDSHESRSYTMVGLDCASRSPAGIAYLSLPRRRPSYISNLYTPNAAPRLAVQRFSCGRTCRNSPLRGRHPVVGFLHVRSAPPATKPVVERDERTVQTVCAADCTVSVYAADGLEQSERLEPCESLRHYLIFSFSLKDFIAGDFQIPLFPLSK